MRWVLVSFPRQHGGSGDRHKTHQGHYRQVVAFHLPRLWSVYGLPCKSKSREKYKSPDARFARSAQRRNLRNPQLAACASRQWFLPSQNRTSINCLRPCGPSQKIEFVFAASPETNRGEPRENLSVAQPVNCGTWQPARCVIPFLFPTALRPPRRRASQELRTPGSGDLRQGDKPPSCGPPPA
jgi:hypothetical protein